MNLYTLAVLMDSGDRFIERGPWGIVTADRDDIKGKKWFDLDILDESFSVRTSHIVMMTISPSPSSKAADWWHEGGE